MKRQAQLEISAESQYALNRYKHVLQRVEDLSPVIIRNCGSYIRQLTTWCKCSRNERQEHRSFTPQSVDLSLLIRYREYLQTTLNLKPSTINRTLMSLKRYVAWSKRTQLIQSDRASSLKFVNWPAIGVNRQASALKNIYT